MKITTEDRAVGLVLASGFISLAISSVLLVWILEFDLPDFIRGVGAIMAVVLVVALWAVLGTWLLTRFGFICPRCRSFNLDINLRRIREGSVCICRSAA